MDIHASYSFKYGKNKHLYPKISRYIDYLHKRVHRFHDHLNLPDDINILFKIIRQPVLGFYHSEESQVAIDFTKNTRRDLSLTICHEMIHAEQFKEGRLQSSHTNFFWRGEKWDVPPCNLDYRSYNKLPWEAECRRRELKLFKKVFQLK